MPRKPEVPTRPITGKKQERYLHCSICDMSVVLMLGPKEDRPMHRCQPLHKAMPFDLDVLSSKAPKDSTPWWEQKAKRPRPPTGDSRPRIVL